MLYAESSAVLAWLMGEPDGARVGELLAAAEGVVASDLTLVECERAVIRGETMHAITEDQAANVRERLASFAAHWHLMPIGSDVLGRARRPFPGGPIRTLDALHLATVLTASANVEDLAVLALDRRIRASGTHLGLRVVPALPA